MVYTKEKPLKVGTLCSGYDSQCLALEKLKELHPTFDYDLIFWSEIDKYAIEAHNAIFPQFKDRNLGDMATIDWSKVTEKIDLLTYSTPCQDISNAGTQKGLKEGSGTRSSLLWYTQKAIEALHPRFLMLENVKALTQKKFMPDFRKWLEYLESEGYVNFWKVLNAKDYGVPQNRERVFVISVYNEPDFNFSFPPKEELNKCLEDVLEEEVDESYYLSDERVAGLLESSDKEKLLGNGFEFVPKND